MTTQLIEVQHGDVKAPDDLRREVQQRAALEAFSRGASYFAAANAAGVTRQTIYNWRAADEAFAAALEDAIQAGTDSMEDEARRRAFGWEEKIYNSKGKEVGTRAVHSDRLMEFMLSGRRPEKFRPAKGDVTIHNHNSQTNNTLNALISPEAAKLLEAVALTKGGNFERGKGET